MRRFVASFKHLRVLYINKQQVERLYRDVRAYAIPGGSEEIMLDLSIRQALKVHKALGMKL